MTSNTVPAGITAKDEVWKCVVVPNDGKMDGASASAEVTIANSAPELAAIGNKSVFVGSNLQFSLSAQDADGDTLVYSAKSLPQGATFANNTFNWTPNQRGSYKVTFEVSDGTATDSEEITIEVTAPLAGPTNLTATYVSGAIHLRWQYSGPAGISIEIWRSLNSTAGFELVGTVNTGSYIYSDRTDLEERILYYYKVRAKKDSAYSVFSNVASARTP
jgi:hypothetical protein